MTNRLHDLAASLQETLSGALRANRVAVKHAGSKGDGAEFEWISLLRKHLPDRYRVTKGFVIDGRGGESQQIDLIVYDRQYTPHLYNHAGQVFVPAESVYAVFEVKQKIDATYVEAAGEKAASVRVLERTSAAITHAGGTFKPRPPFTIQAGILALESDWADPFGDSLRSNLEALPAEARLNLGCAAEHGGFLVEYGEHGAVAVTASVPQHSLMFFLFGLLHSLQSLGTVPAVDYKAYLQTVVKLSEG